MVKFFQILMNEDSNLESFISIKQYSNKYISMACYLNIFSLIILPILFILSKQPLIYIGLSIFFCIASLNFLITIYHKYNSHYNLVKLYAVFIMIVTTITYIFGIIPIGKLGLWIYNINTHLGRSLVGSYIVAFIFGLSIIEILINIIAYCKRDWTKLSPKDSRYSSLYVYLFSTLISFSELIFITLFKITNISTCIEVAIICLLAIVFTLSGGIFIATYKTINKYKRNTNLTLTFTVFLLGIIVIIVTSNK